MRVQYTTRSAIEEGSNMGGCLRKRWFYQFFEGTGIVLAGEYIPFVTGGAIHKGVEERSLGASLEVATERALDKFYSEVTDKHLGDEQAAYTREEQAALVEALLRAWELRERQRVLDRFEIVSVEKEYQVPLDRNGDLILLSKPDQLLQDRQRGEFYNYSIKSMKQWYPRLDKSYKVDLQGKTEAIAIWFNKKIKVVATKFCFLIKGRRDEELTTKLEDGQVYESSLWVTKSPLIYGYRAEVEGKMKYCHSDKIYKPENKSGFGKLPKKEGWERFQVWKTKFGVAKWVDALASGKIQPELGDVVKDQVITPVEAHRTRENLQSTYIQIKHSEKSVFLGAYRVKNGDSLDEHFPQAVQHCYFPSQCEYLKICANGGEDYDAAIADDPLGSGLYVRREPHYETEREARK
jgi:hypothetical protein